MSETASEVIEDKKVITLKPSNDKGGKKKFMVIMPAKKLANGKLSKKTKIVRFGAAGYEDFTIHHDEKRRLRYVTRHDGGNENWNDINTPAFWSRWLLWNKPSIEESIADIEEKHPEYRINYER